MAIPPPQHKPWWLASRRDSARHRSMPVTLANMRSHGCRDVLIYCGNAPRCWHRAQMNVDSWPDDASFGQIGERMVCTRCGLIGAEVRPDWSPAVAHRQ
jgi:hypothetical protein